MFRKLLTSLFVAIDNIRNNPVHTLLSTLGIIIGVAALVAILSLIDGMEQYARSQIATTTSLEYLEVSTVTTQKIDGVSIKKKDYPVLDIEAAEKLKGQLSKKTEIALSSSKGSRIHTGTDDSRPGVVLEAVTPKKIGFLNMELASGRLLNEQDVEMKKQVAVLTLGIANRLAGDGNIIGRTVVVDEKEFRVVGVLKETKRNISQRAFVPLTVFSESELKSYPPRLVVRAEQVEDVPVIEEEIRQWLSTHYSKADSDFRVVSNEFRAEQARQGMLIFKIVMGLITGISVLVGGIGVMNVLLISVKERTGEIGIRKAAGAKKKDIVLQFLAESITISAVGCFIGLLTGMISVTAMMPLISHFADVQFKAAFTPATFLVVAVAAVFIGIVFGTYPASRAARLTPIDAIRRE